MRSDLVTHLLVTFGSVFAIVDPFAALPIFIAMTGDRPEAERRRIALRASVTCLAVLVVFGAAGSLIMSFFSISLPAFKIAGGILLFGVGLEMLRAKPSPTRSTAEEETEAQQKEDVAIIPLGLPLLAGPGAIATVMVLAGKAESLPKRGAVFASVIVVSLLTLAILRSAAFVVRWLGKTGINLIGRIMGLILAATAVQFVIDGVREAFPKALGG